MYNFLVILLKYTIVNLFKDVILLLFNAYYHVITS